MPLKFIRINNWKNIGLIEQIPINNDFNTEYINRLIDKAKQLRQKNGLSLS